MTHLRPDRLQEIFALREEFMREIADKRGAYGSWPVDISQKKSQQLVREVTLKGVEEIFVTEEDEYFPPPRNIRDLQMAVDTAITVMAGAPLVTTASMDDRALAASAVLETLLLP